MKISHTLATCLIFFAAMCPTRIEAHPTGVSKVDMVLRPDTLEALVDVNSEDLRYALGLILSPELTRADYLAMSDRIAYYFQTRFDVKFDGRSADMNVLKWKKHGGDLAEKLDSTDMVDTTIALRLAWPIPPGSKRTELGSTLFAELSVQPLCHLRIEYRDREIKRRFLSLDDRFTMSVVPDSLEAYYSKASRPGGAGSDAPSDGESIVGRFIKLGFIHILPEGLDHILFVLGLFFFSTLMRPLLIQVTAFTVAHSITLGLSILGIFSLPATIVEPLIALSIAVVALENIFVRKLRPSRFFIVFVFGLIHGLGFAGVLKELGLPEGQFITVLLSFNLGVELGQLAVIGIAFGLTFWMSKKPWYFRFVVVPVSTAIAAMGLFWFIQRLIQA